MLRVPPPGGASRGRSDARHRRSCAQVHLGLERALAVLEERATEDSLQASFLPIHTLTVLADVYRAVGDISLATETVEHALKISNEREELGFEAWTMFVMAGIKNKANQPGEADRWYRHALQQASNLSMRPLMAHCHRGLANSYFRQGDKNQAQLEDEAARKIYRSLGMTFWLKSK